MSLDRKKLVLFVEGTGEVAAGPTLVKRLLTESNMWSSLILVPTPFRVKGWGYLLKEKGKEWVALSKSSDSQASPSGWRPIAS